MIFKKSMKTDVLQWRQKQIESGNGTKLIRNLDKK